jgi:hypothetical protein
MGSDLTSRAYATSPTSRPERLQDLRVKSRFATVCSDRYPKKGGEVQVTEAHLADLVEAGLLHEHGEPRLTVKGRDWLRVLEDALTQEIAATAQTDEDFVQSTNGLFR